MTTHLSERDADAIERIEDEILDALALSQPRSKDMDVRIERLKESYAGQFYSTIIQSLTGVTMPEDEARLAWDAVLQHKYHLSQKIARDVGVHVAALDYFKNLRGLIDEARIVSAGALIHAVRLSLTDGLTGLFNHRAFQEEFSRLLRRSEKRGQPFAVGLFDVDHFKNYNDRNGHLAGDAILFEVSCILCAETREGMDIAARYGGEEFALLLPEADRAQAVHVAERIRVAIEERLRPSAKLHPVGQMTISGGLAVYPEDGRTKNELLTKADKRLYEAKAGGRNRIV